MDENYSITNVVNSGLNDNGLYAIAFAFRAMVGLGRFQFIDRYVLYDRATKVVVDLTDALRPGDILNFNMQEFTIMDERIEYLEDYLTGRKVPIGEIPVDMGNQDTVTATKYFYALELTGELYTPIRVTMVELKKAKDAYDAQRCAIAELVKSSTFAVIGK